MGFIVENTQIKENWNASNSGVSIPSWSSPEVIGTLIGGSSFYNLFNKKIPFKILSLGIIDEIKCKKRTITFKDIIVNDNNSMVKVNNVDINCYINNDLRKHLKIKRGDYDNNVIHLIENNKNLTVSLNNYDSKYNILLVNYHSGIYLLKKIGITNSFDDCEFKYEIIPNNTDFDINLEKHKISKTLNLLRSKDTLLGSTLWVEVSDMYNQDYINCSVIKNWVNNKLSLVKESLLSGEYNLDIDLGVKNKDYRFIGEYRDVKNGNETYFNGYFYSNDDNNTFTISTKKIKKEDLYLYPENTSKELFKKLDITGLKLSVSPVTYRIFLDGKKREGHGETYKETELVEINTHYILDGTSEYYTDTQIVPSSKMQAVTTYKAYHCYGLTEFKTISKGYKYISTNDLNGCNLLTVKSKLLDKAKRDDCVFAVALKLPLNNYKAYLSVSKDQILYTPPTLNKTKNKVGSYSYYSITDSTTGFTYYYLSDSDGKIVLKKSDELKSSSLSSNTNLFEWLLGTNINLFDKYTTFVDDEVRYYNYKNGEEIEINKSHGDFGKIISFYVDYENVENVLFENLKLPIDFDGNIDSENRDDVPDDIEGVQIYRKNRINQIKYYRIVLLKDNDDTSSIFFTKDMCIYNPIIYDANVITPKEEGEKLNTICYDFRAPAFKLNYKELHPKEYINGNYLDKTYLPKPFYEIIN